MEGVCESKGSVFYIKLPPWVRWRGFPRGCEGVRVGGLLGVTSWYQSPQKPLVVSVTEAEAPPDERSLENALVSI